MTRREFLRETAKAGVVVGAGAVSLGASPSALPPQAFRVGYQIFGWSRYFPSAWWRGAEAVGALGYPGIEGEYTIAELYEGREEEFEARMRRAGVRLAALYSTSDLERPHERYENLRKNLAAAAFLARMGGRMIVIGGTEGHERTPALFDAWSRAASELGRRTFETHGVRLGFHPHMGALIESREHIARVMDATDAAHVFLAPDTGHLLAGGSDPVEVFRTYRERIAHAHLKDYAPPANGTGRGVFLPLGKGRIDFAALVAIMREARFGGWLNVELDGGRGIDPAKVARHAKEYVTGTLGLRLDPTAEASNR